MDDIKNLRAEFNTLKEQNDACDEGCETEFEEEYPDYVIEITTKMMSPARCGVYFSKMDIKSIAAECKENILLKQRQRMLADMLKSVFEVKEMEHMFNTIKKFLDKKISYYDELADTFPSSQTIFNEHKEKSKNFKDSLDRILKESKEDI